MENIIKSFEAWAASSFENVEDLLTSIQSKPKFNESSPNKCGNSEIHNLVKASER